VSADCDPNPAFASDLLAHLAAADAELYVSLGDFPYTDNGPPAIDVPSYRARYAELLTLPAVRAWLQTVGVMAIYDDHEFRNNWDAHFVAVEAARYAAAIQVWDEWFPLRDVVGEIRYRRWRWGAHVEGFLLDTRRFRSADDAPDDANKTMLGQAQRQWLLDGLAASAATFKLIFTTVPLDFGTGNDDWTSFATERDAIFAAIVAAKVTGVLFISGDQHYFASHRHAHGVREFQIGPLARGLGTPGPMAPGVLYRSIQYNAGIIDVTADALTFAGLGADGTRFHEETLTVADLTPA
jgi:alkaline phosphatase D